MGRVGKKFTRDENFQADRQPSWNWIVILSVHAQIDTEVSPSVSRSQAALSFAQLQTSCVCDVSRENGYYNCHTCNLYTKLASTHVHTHIHANIIPTFKKCTSRSCMTHCGEPMAMVFTAENLAKVSCPCMYSMFDRLLRCAAPAREWWSSGVREKGFKERARECDGAGTGLCDIFAPVRMNCRRFLRVSISLL